MIVQKNRSTLALFLGMIALFMIIVASNAVQATAAPLTMSMLPNNPKPGYPVQITSTVTNTEARGDILNAAMYVDGNLVMNSSVYLQPGQSQVLSYTTGAPPQGQSIRVATILTSRSGGISTSAYILIPQSPPEAWMSFMAFSTFAMSLVSSTTTTLTSTFTLTYYAETMNLSSATGGSSDAFVVGIFLSLLLVSLLIFVEMTDKGYGKISPRLSALRGRYGLLAANLVLVFIGIVITKLYLLMHP